MQALTDTLLPIVNTIMDICLTISWYSFLWEPACTSASRRNRSGPLLWRRLEAGIRKPDFKRQEA